MRKNRNELVTFFIVYVMVSEASEGDLIHATWRKESSVHVVYIAAV